MKKIKMSLGSMLLVAAVSVEVSAESKISWLASIMAAGQYAVAQSTGPAYCTPDGSCSAPAPACGQTTSGFDNCGNQCSKTGPACCVPDGSCSAPAPACGQTTSGFDNCGNQCSKTGPACPVATSVSLSANPVSLKRGQTATFNAIVRDQFGAVMSGATVVFSLSGAGSLSATSGVSNTLGEVSTAYLAPDKFQGSSFQAQVQSCLQGTATCSSAAVTVSK